MFKLSNFFGKMEEATGGEAGGAAGGAPAPSAEPQPEPSHTDSGNVDPEPQPEPEPEPQPEPEPTPPVETGEGYEDTFFGHAAEMFDTHNLDGQIAVDYLIEHGEFAPEHMKAMEDAMGKAQAQILAQGIKQELANQEAAAEKHTQDIYNAVGGQENFDAAVAWAASEEGGWSDEERADMNKMLEMGGNMSKWAAQLLWIGYSNAGNPAAAVTTKPNVRDGQKAQPSSPDLITAQEYQAARAKATTQAEVAELVKRANYTRTQSNAHELGWKWG